MKDRKAIIGLLVVITVVLVAGIVIWSFYKKNNNDEVTYEVVDELSRGKYFIKDWYDEVSKNADYLKVFNNELQIGSYSLTYENRRIRAVYPKGERFFQFYSVTHAEFSQRNGCVYCELEYENNGEFVFLVG